MRLRRPKPTKGTPEATAAVAGDVPVAVIAGRATNEMSRLRARLEVQDDGVPGSIAVTSAVTGEGVTFTSQALAVVLARDGGQPTCHVSAGWTARHGAPGFAELIDDDVALETIVMETSVPQLSIIPPGNPQPGKEGVAPTAKRAEELVALLREKFAHVVLDLPALSVSPVALILSGAADASLIVARHRATRLDQVESAVAELRHTRLLGVVLNDFRPATPGLLRRRLIGV